MNLFEIIDNEEVKKFEEEQKSLADKNNAAKNDKEKESEKKSKESKTTKSNNQEKKPKFNPNSKIIEEMNKYPQIVVKAYGTELFSIEIHEGFKLGDLEDYETRIINEFQYHEFSEGIIWHVVPNKEKTIGYLIATGKFQSKG